MTQKMTKLQFLRPPEHIQGGKIAKFENRQICLVSGPRDEMFEKKFNLEP
jgi:hypothetical protein